MRLDAQLDEMTCEINKHERARGPASDEEIFLTRCSECEDSALICNGIVRAPQLQMSNEDHRRERNLR